MAASLPDLSVIAADIHVLALDLCAKALVNAADSTTPPQRRAALDAIAGLAAGLEKQSKRMAKAVARHEKALARKGAS